MNFGALLSNKFLNQLKAVFGKTLYQVKTLSISRTSSVSDEPDLRFSNLTVGLTYKVTVYCSANVFSGSSADAFITVKNDGVNIVQAGVDSTPGVDVRVRTRYTSSVIFTATNPTLVTDIVISPNGSIESGSFVILEELPNHEETNQWN